MAYLSEPLLQNAWTDLNARVGKINIPLQLWKSPQNPAKPFLDIYAKWDERLNAKHDDRGKVVRPFTVRELEEWSAALAQQQTLVGTLEAAYPQLAPSEPVRKIVVKEEQITGELPWWYWPLRIGAGIGAGYAVYRFVRPMTWSYTPASQPAFAGLTNQEGMTWAEWRAAVVGSGKRPANDQLSADDKKKMKSAWQNGEDPSDWRKYFSDRSYARAMGDR